MHAHAHTCAHVFPQLLDKSPQPEECTHKTLVHQQMVDLLDQLPKLERDVITLRYGALVFVCVCVCVCKRASY